jgi:phasin family protein
MYQAPEQFVALNKANLEAAARFANIALGGAERILEIQMNAAKSALADSVEGAKTLSTVKDLQQFASVKDTVAQPALEKATEYVRNVYEAASDTQAEIGKLVELQMAEFNKQFIVALDKMAENAPAGAEAGISALKTAFVTGNAAYDNMSKAVKQFNDVAKTNIETAAKRATSTVKKAKK